MNNPSAVFAGDAHACATTEDGLVCWGSNGLDQADPPGIDTTTVVGLGGDHSCALDGSYITCWGDNTEGQTDPYNHLVDVLAISGGQFHGCALKADRTVSCWGADGELNSNDGQASVPYGIRNVVSMDAGDYHTCAISADSGIHCWGYNGRGQLNAPKF